MAARPPVHLTPAQIAQMAKARGLDPDAVLRVARAEGLSGGIGDGGHAFGPFQMNNAGGVLTGRFQGQSPEQINEWAWSPQGVAEALGGISKVAGGRRGADAVRAIVTKYERPQDPNGEITRALGGSAAPTKQLPWNGQPMQDTVSRPPQPGQDPRRALLQALTGASTSGDYTGFYKALAGARNRPQPSAAATSTAPGFASTVSAQPTRGGGGLAELLHEGVGGPTHSTGEHIHVASRDPQTMLALIQQAQQMGLSARENPYVDPVDPVHAPHSFHNQTFAGKYNGRQLGEAVAVSGPKMSAYEQWVRKTFGAPR